MGIFVNEETKVVEHSGVKFEVKELGYGEYNQINKKAMKINFATQKPEVDLAVLQEEKLKSSLVSITLEDGTDIPVTLDTIRKLKSDVANTVLSEIDEDNEVSKKEKKK